MIRVNMLGKVGYFKNSDREAIDAFVINQVKKNDFDTILKDFRSGVDAAKKDYLRIEALNSKKCIGRYKMVFKHPAGIKTANYFMYFRYKLRVSFKKTVEEAITNEDLLRKVIDGIIRINRRTSRIDLRDLFTVGGFSASAQKLGNFMPAVAKTIYEEYAPIKGAKILDMSAGFGGRLVGAMSSKYNYEYVGVDPSAQAVDGLNKLIKFLGVTRARIIKLPFEDSNSILDDNSFDLAFTSPPYFNKEIYSDELTQSCNRYQEIDAWVEGFLKKSFEIVYKKLKKSRPMIINIANVKIKSKIYNLEDITIEKAKEVGFKYLGEKWMEMAKIPPKDNKKVKIEKIFFFEK